MNIYKNLREWLLNSSYPVYQVAMMTDEEVVGEYEAITGDVSIPQPIGGKSE